MFGNYRSYMDRRTKTSLFNQVTSHAYGSVTAVVTVSNG